MAPPFNIINTVTTGSFEVLSQPIVPDMTTVPYVEQGFFVQITNQDARNANTPSILFQGNPAFVASKDSVKLFTNYIDQSGAAVPYPVDQFLSKQGFTGITIPPKATLLFGVQYVLVSSASPRLVGTTPQDSLSARGLVTIFSANYMQFLATVRQVFTTFDSNKKPTGMSGSAYSVPTVSAYLTPNGALEQLAAAEAA